MHLVSIRLQFDPPPSHCLRKQYENKRLFNPYAYCLILWLDAHCLCPKNVFHQLPTRGKWMTLTSPKLEYSSGIFNKQGTTSSSIQTCGTLVTHRPWPCSHPCYAFHTLFTCFTVISSQNIYKTYLPFVRNTYYCTLYFQYCFYLRHCYATGGSYRPTPVGVMVSKNYQKVSTGMETSLNLILLCPLLHNI